MTKRSATCSKLRFSTKILAGKDTNCHSNGGGRGGNREDANARTVFLGNLGF